MTMTLPLYQYNDFYVPGFRVSVRNKGMEAVVARDVTSLVYTDSLESLDSVDIVLNNWDDSRAGMATQFKYFVDDAAKYADLFSFDRNSLVDVSLGYQNVGLVKMLTGTLESVEPSYPAGGGPTVKLRLINRLKQLKDKQNAKAWVDKSTADIARAIASTHNLQIVVETHQNDDDQPQPYVFQDNQYDIVFLLQRARRIGYDVWLDDDQTMHFGPATASDAGGQITYKLGFRRSMMDFSPRFSMNEQVGTVKVNARDQAGKATFSGSATRAEVGLNPDLERFVTAEIQAKVKTVSNQPLHVNGQAKQLAREIMRDIMQKMLTATVNCPGLPDIRTGRMVEITDVGSRFSGQYFVTSTTHTIDDGGYRTSFTARREQYA